MNKTELSTYHQIFYNEYKKNYCTINEYSICGYSISDVLKANKLKSAIKSTVLRMPLLNCKISEADTGLFFITNKNICKIKIFENIISKKQIVNYINKITYLENINLINIPDSNHYDILDHHNLISSNILNTFKTET